MNTKTEIENLKNRLNKLREALKSGNSRFSTPTQSRSNAKSRDTSPTPKAKSKDNTPTREKKLSPLTREIMLSPLTKGSAWKNTPKSKSPSESISGESSSIFSKQSNPRRSTVNISASPDRKQMMRNNSQVQEMSDKIEKLRQTLFEEINSKIQTLGNLQSSVENLKYQLSNKKQEKKNINNDTNYKSACEQNSREIDNMKLRMDSIRTETQEIYSQMVSDKDAIDMINPLINMLKNENTVLKFENKKAKKNVSDTIEKLKMLREKYDVQVKIVDAMKKDIQRNIEKTSPKDKKKRNKSAHYILENVK